MQGRRVDVSDVTEMVPGDYGHTDVHTWMACAPNGFYVNLEAHDVVEHEDGTLTVDPSILVDDGRTSWHGFLRAGVWSEC